MQRRQRHGAKPIYDPKPRARTTRQCSGLAGTCQPSVSGSSNALAVSHAGATREAASAVHLDTVMSDVSSTDDTASVHQRRMRRNIYNAGQGREESYYDRYAKRKRCNGTISCFIDENAVARDGNSALMRSGHSYERVQATGHAHVHLGDRIKDQVIINHNYLGLFAAMDVRLSQNAETQDKVAIVRLAASIIVMVVLNAMVRFLFLLQGMMYCTLPKVVRRRLPGLLDAIHTPAMLFEDALGRFERIDLNVVADWTTFHYNLTCAFVNKPGYRRVAVAGYRLFDRTRSSELIDPKQPPLFASVFRPYRHLRMSIHFEWSEVSVDVCPKCGLEQACEAGKETTCKNQHCGFHYRSEVEDSRVEELNADVEYDDSHIHGKQHGSARKKLLKDRQEHPSWFERISVSKQPAAHSLSAALLNSHTFTTDYRETPQKPMDIDVTQRAWSTTATQGTGAWSTTATQGTDSQERFERGWFCPYPGCFREDGGYMSFYRKDDLNRHMQKHVPHCQLHSCPIPGCRRVGQYGLPRRDKLLEHIRETHRIRNYSE